MYNVLLLLRKIQDGEMFITNNLQLSLNLVLIFYVQFLSYFQSDVSSS